MSILCFGEPLMRLATLNHERLDSALNLNISYCGAETVVAVTLAQQGESAAFATKLASNRLGTNALMTLTRYGVDTSRVIRSNDRMGIYFSERGLSIRPSIVTYDRSGTAMANALHTDFDWDHLLNGIEVLFFSGVAPAISEELYLACKEGLTACKGRGIRTVMDLNYRETMWESRQVAQRKVGSLLSNVDLLVASEDDIIGYEGAQVETEDVFDYCLSWAKGMLADYPLRGVCVVVRNVDRYDFAAIRGAIVTREGCWLSDTQQVSVADISSCGSVFSAAIIHGDRCGWDPQFIVDYATMSSAYKATIYGDYSSATESDIASLLAAGFKPRIRQ
ncbi:MAG: sugar kinase [Atopobiaceae bacterium]|nr:sugar kinase [Atopobiaceae bacterium]